MEETDNLNDAHNNHISKQKYRGVFLERSDMAQEIICRQPDFWERWSLLLFLLVLLLLTASTWFISSPDIVKANAVLTGDDFPKEIIPKQTGRLAGLLTKNNNLVKQGEILGWIESDASFSKVMSLSKKLDSSLIILSSDKLNTISDLFRERLSGLGELQSNYQSFIADLQTFNDYHANGFYAKKRLQLINDIGLLHNIKENVSVEKNLTIQEAELAQKTFEMNESLYKEKVISAEEYRQAQNALLSKRKSTPRVEANVLSQQSLILERQKTLDQLDHDILQQQQMFEQSVQTLRSHVDQWIRQYTIQAPAEGRIVLSLPLQQNQYVQQGKPLGYINPSGTSYYAEIKLAQGNLGKIDSGMQVQLRFEAYPYYENGVVIGTLDYISNVAVDGQFVGTVRLKKGLQTSQGTSLQYKSGLKAEALIITKDMRLLERLYYSIVRSSKLH